MFLNASNLNLVKINKNQWELWREPRLRGTKKNFQILSWKLFYAQFDNADYEFADIFNQYALEK